MSTLSGSDIRCVVDASHGARLASLEFCGVELMVSGSPTHDPLRWGCYPMAPWAGRLRQGLVTIGGCDHRVEGVGRAGDHPLHGTIADRPWMVVEASPRRFHARIDLGPRWPVAGTVDHVVTLHDGGVTCILSLAAHDCAFPAQVGWHPWFAEPWRRQVDFRARYLRDDAVLPTGALQALTGGELDDQCLDDCFVSPRHPPRLTHPNGLVVEITSDVSHWVVYDEPGHAVCVEPQSGPPDGPNLEPVMVPAGGVLQRWMRLSVVEPASAVTEQ